MSDKTEILKPCPWCGVSQSHLEVDKFFYQDEYKFRVRCVKCGVTGPNEANTPDSIISWNLMPRDSIAPLQRSVEE